MRDLAIQDKFHEESRSALPLFTRLPRSLSRLAMTGIFCVTLQQNSQALARTYDLRLRVVV